MTEASLQERYSPKSICFGCGPANPKGLRIGSRPDSTDPDLVTAEWTPEPHHEAFPGVLNGGIIGALLDCHSNWTACYALMRRAGAAEPPCTVTAYFNVALKRPTPSKAKLELKARAVKVDGDRAEIEAELWSEGKLCATCKGLFVAVKPDHPAYHRW